jgi:hypothetical protein
MSIGSDDRTVLGEEHDGAGYACGLAFDFFEFEADNIIGGIAHHIGFGPLAAASRIRRRLGVGIKRHGWELGMITVMSDYSQISTR